MTRIQVIRISDPAAFADLVMPWLAAHGSRHEYVAGQIEAIRQAPGLAAQAEHQPLLLQVRAGNDQIGLALWSHLHLLLAFEDPPPDFTDLVREVAATHPHLAGVLGPGQSAASFVAEWTRQTGQPHSRSMTQVFHELDRVLPTPPVPGRLRAVTEGDRDLLIAWLSAFRVEALPGEPPRNIDALVDRRLRGQGELVLWDDSGPRAMAGVQSHGLRGPRIGSVWTPPEYRRRGYATACVAALSQKWLDAGSEACFLFTDLANPTSNHIYQLIGYRPIVIFERYGLGLVSASPD